MIEFECPKCGDTIEVPDKTTGKAHTCPNCGAAVEIPDDLERDAVTELASTESRNVYAPSRLEFAELPSPKESWIATIPPIVSVVVLFVLVYPGALALHVWTSALFYHRWGEFWGFAAFFSPPLPEVVAVFACFWWHIWYYILAIALWLVSLGAAAFVEKDAAFRFRPALFAGWICVVGILSVSFGQYAWRYSLGPTSRTATDQTQLEDCAKAVVACIHSSSSDDPDDLASAVTAKKKMAPLIRGYDRASLDQVCSLVDECLRFEHSLGNDMLAYMEKLSRTSETSKFRISERTRQILDKLPNKLRTFLEVNVTETEKLDSSTVNPPKNWREIMDKGATRIWSIYGQTYSELLGRPMPAFAD